MDDGDDDDHVAKLSGHCTHTQRCQNPIASNLTIAPLIVMSLGVMV